MEQFRRLFNHTDTVSGECKSFCKVHDTSLSEVHEGVAGVSRSMSNVREKLTTPDNMIATPSKALARLDVCNKLCENISAMEAEFPRNPQDKDNFNEQPVYDMLRSQADEINAEFDRRRDQLRNMYTEMKTHSNVSSIE